MRRYGLYLLLVLSLAGRIEHRYFYRNFFLDTEVQVGAAQNILEGKGFSYPVWKAERGCETAYAPMPNFMPAFTLSVIPFYWLTSDWFDAVLGLEIFALLLLYGAFHLIMRHLGLERSWPYLFYLAWQVVSPAPLHYLAAADLLAISVFLWAIYFILQAIQRNALAFSLLALVLIAASATIKHSYWPLTAIYPISMVGFSLRDGSLKGLTWRSVLSWAILMPLIWGLWQVFHSELNYLNPVEKGWYWHHLLHIRPFPIQSFLYFGIPHLLSIHTFSAGLYFVLKIGFHLISFALLFVAIQRLWQAYQKTPLLSPLLSMGILMLVCVSLNLAMLSYLSLRYPPEAWNWVGFWTYVMETRYYIPSMYLLLIVLLYRFAHPLYGWERWLNKGFCIAILLINLSYPLYLKYQIYFKGELNNTFFQSDQRLIKEVLEDSKALPACVLASAPYTRMGEWAGIPSIEWELFIQEKTPPTSAWIYLSYEMLQASETQVQLNRLKARRHQALKQGMLYRIE